MKLDSIKGEVHAAERPFSILERIELGETQTDEPRHQECGTFSILERIELGETMGVVGSITGLYTFSILERIYLGEPDTANHAHASARTNFQYPRTDRIG